MDKIENESTQNSLVSIIVACYNQAQYLPETLDSVLAQSYVNWECIIVNDGSPDNTDEIAEMYCKKDSRFKYIYKENGGPSSARNAGLKISKGEYIQLLDSDDKLHFQKLEKQISTFENNEKLGISITNYCMFDDKNNIFPSSDKWNNKLSNNFRSDILFRWDRNFSIPIHSALFKRTLIGQLKFNENIFAQEDWFFWIEISENNPKVEYIDEELAFYRLNPKSRTRDIVLMKTNTIRVFLIILQKLTGKEKEDFILRFGEDLAADSHKIDVLTFENIRIRKSKAYRIGKFMLKPLSFIKNKIQ